MGTGKARRDRMMGWILLPIFFLSACGPGCIPSESSPQVERVVEEFDTKLQTVSLLSPLVAEEITRAYTGYVSPDLLDSWIDDPTRAPGRLVSSPWPDRIEIQSVCQRSKGEYLVKGTIIEVTSAELMNGGTANEIPVRLMVSKDNGDWLIMDFTEEGARP